MTDERLTVERLGRDALDVRELQRAGLLSDDWVTLRPSLRWPRIATMRLARYRILLELTNQSVPQGIRVSWTRCHFGGFRPWLHCPHCERRVARLFKGFAGYFCRACHLRELAAEQEGTGVSAGLSDLAAARRLAPGSGCDPTPSPLHGAEDLREAVRANGVAREAAAR
jgi:hypothetical protein